MTSTQPPRLAMALLDRYIPDNEPLAGDLAEGFAATGSRVWLWRQVLLAILLTALRRDRRPRPLRLMDDAHSHAAASWEQRRETLKPINITASPITGVGGLGLVALGVIVAVTRPGALVIVLGGVVGGALLGIVMVAISRHRMQSQPGGGSASVLFGRQD